MASQGTDVDMRYYSADLMIIFENEIFFLDQKKSSMYMCRVENIILFGCKLFLVFFLCF